MATMTTWNNNKILISYEDKKLKEKILKYQKTKSAEEYKEIIAILSPFIYNYVMFAFHQFKDEDMASEFYIYVLNRLEKILDAYEIREDANFYTYFFFVLRRLYFNLLKKQQNQKIVEVFLEQEQWDIIPTREEANEDRIYLQEIYKDAKQGEYEKAILLSKLYYMEDLGQEDLNRIAEVFGVDLANLQNRIYLLVNNKKTTNINPTSKINSYGKIAKFIGIPYNQVRKILGRIRHENKNTTSMAEQRRK